jgi:hypothetical protein
VNKQPTNPTPQGGKRGQTLTLVLPRVARYYADGIGGFEQMAIDPRPGSRVDRLFAGEYDEPLPPRATSVAAALEADAEYAAYVAETNASQSEREGMQEWQWTACLFASATTERERQALADQQELRRHVMTLPFALYADGYQLALAAFKERHGRKAVGLSKRQKAEVDRILRRTRKREQAEALAWRRQTKTLAQGSPEQKAATVRDWHRRTKSNGGVGRA